MKQIDPYQILGVGRTATTEEIKKAFRKLSMRLHPDKDGGDREKFQNAREAYDLLSDPTRRQAFDQSGTTSVARHRETARAIWANCIETLSGGQTHG